MPNCAFGFGGGGNERVVEQLFHVRIVGMAMISLKLRFEVVSVLTSCWEQKREWPLRYGVGVEFVEFSYMENHENLQSISLKIAISLAI
jgi:hypothetical protein